MRLSLCLQALLANTIKIKSENGKQKSCDQSSDPLPQYMGLLAVVLYVRVLITAGREVMSAARRMMGKPALRTEVNAGADGVMD